MFSSKNAWEVLLSRSQAGTLTSLVNCMNATSSTHDERHLKPAHPLEFAHRAWS